MTTMTTIRHSSSSQRSTMTITILALAALIYHDGIFHAEAFAPSSSTPSYWGQQVSHSYRHQTQQQQQVLKMSDQPSDTSSDPYYEDSDEDDVVVTVESEEFDPSDNDVLVTSILDLVPVSMAGSTVNDEKRAEINEALLKLEALNPTEDPAMSPLLNGVWELKYAGNYASEGAIMSPTRQIALFVYSGGYSPALFALELAQKLPKFLFEFDDETGLQISISRNQPRVEGSIKVKVLGGEAQTVSVSCRLETLSGIRLREVYESSNVVGQQVELPTMLQYSRDMYVTYVDEDILVVRDGSGIPELLVRKEKTFTRNWGTDP